MSSPVNALRHSAAIAAMILLGVSGPAAAAGETCTLAAEEAFDEATGVATFRGPQVGHGERELSGFDDNDGIAHGEAMREPVEFTGIVGRYLAPRSPVPADYIETVRVHEPDPWVGRFTDIW